MQRNGERHLKSSGGMTACLAMVFAWALAVAGSQSAAAASITIDAERDGDAIDIRASVVLNADAATAWRVLTDYDRYTEFIPDLRVSRVVARRDATVTVEQSGDAALWLFKIAPGYHVRDQGDPAKQSAIARSSGAACVRSQAAIR